jgi:hypothetical protein
MKILSIIFLATALAATPAHAKVKRSHKALASFKAANPCPATSIVSKKCVGYIIDHIEPLCAGGADSVSNLQWQTVAEAKAKDVLEKRQCAALRRKHRSD